MKGYIHQGTRKILHYSSFNSNPNYSIVLSRKRELKKKKNNGNRVLGDKWRTELL
jgi:hypothetical protein